MPPIEIVLIAVFVGFLAIAAGALFQAIMLGMAVKHITRREPYFRDVYAITLIKGVFGYFLFDVPLTYLAMMTQASDEVLSAFFFGSLPVRFALSTYLIRTKFFLRTLRAVKICSIYWLLQSILYAVFLGIILMVRNAHPN